MKNAYSIRSLGHTYDGKVVLDIPHLDIPQGQTCLFTGPNGSGKTTLLSILALLKTPSKGSVHLNGVECTRDPSPGLRHQVTLVHQNPILFSTSVRNNLVYGLRTRKIAAGEIDQRLQWITEEMKLSGLIDKHARKLSGGESQRVILARALITEAPILLLDEPTNSLDDAHRPVLAQLLRKISYSRGTTVIVATHDSNLIASLSGRVLRMDGGKIQSTES